VGVSDEPGEHLDGDMSAPDPHSPAGAYALDALDADERVAFERHLPVCPECRREVTGFAATAGRLALAVSATPPPSLKESVLGKIGDIRQERPGSGGGTPGAGSPGAGSPTAGSPTAGSPTSTPWPRRFLLAACLTAVALGGVATWQHQEAGQARAEARDEARRARAGADEVAAVLAAGDARTHAAALPEGARGVVVTSAKRNRAVFTASGLGAPPDGKVYELWFDDHGTMRPAGLLDRGRSHQLTLMDGAVDGATGMGITVEPAGGSRRPTLPPVGLIGFHS
jgi:anti-sigma-K factor RskA